MFNITYQVKETTNLSIYSNIASVMPDDIIVFNGQTGTVHDVHDSTDVVDIIINEKLLKVGIDQIKKVNFHQSLVGYITITTEKLEVILIENVFRKITDTGVVFYHEIPSISSLVKDTVVY